MFYLSDREQSGLCISDLTIRDVVELASDSYRMTLTLRHPLPDNTRFTRGSSVVISEDNDHTVIIATGFVLEVQKGYISVLLDRYLSKTLTIRFMNTLLEETLFSLTY